MIEIGVKGLRFSIAHTPNIIMKLRSRYTRLSKSFVTNQRFEQLTYRGDQWSPEGFRLILGRIVR